MKIIGIKKFSSKNGKKCCMVYVEDEFSLFDRGSELCVGRKTDVVWLPEGLAFKLSDKDVGKTINLITTFSAGKSYLNDITVN